MFNTSPSSTTSLFPSRRCRPRLTTSAREPASTRSFQRITSLRMKPRAMSEWIVAAASSAVSPRRNGHARVSFSAAVKNEIRSTASNRRRAISPIAPAAPSLKAAASSSGSSASSASSFASRPPRPFRTSISGFVVSGSSPAGSSPGHSDRGRSASRCASNDSSCSTSSRSCASPDFACFRTRSSRRSTWSRSAISSSSRSVTRSSSGFRVPDQASRTTSKASTWRRFPSSCAPVPGTSTTRTAAGVIFFAFSTAATGSRRSSGIVAMPTFSFPGTDDPVRVSALKSVVLPELGRPTMPTESAMLRALVIVELPLQGGQRPVLERFDRALGLVEDRRGLRVREVEDELQRQHLLLLVRELLDQLQHALPADRLERLLLGRTAVAGIRLGDLLFGLPALVGAEVVHREVVRDPEQPGRERRRTPAELADRLEHLHEHLRRQVLGVVAVADAHVQVAVDAIEMDQVELLERFPIPLFAALDESRQLV